MLSVFNFFQTIGFYGFAAWVPTLLIAKGITITHSLRILLHHRHRQPVRPAARHVWSPTGSSANGRSCAPPSASACSGFLFAPATTPVLLIVLGVLVTLSNNWLSFAFHNYQAELFPTRIRARAVGFVYAWSRLSAVFAGLFIAFFLHTGGVAGGVLLHRLRDG